VKPGGILRLKDITLHNDCGDEWQGIEVQSLGKKKGMIYKSGKVKILNTITSNQI
jgi:hypothetical protein